MAKPWYFVSLNLQGSYISSNGESTCYYISIQAFSWLFGAKNSSEYESWISMILKYRIEVVNL